MTEKAGPGPFATLPQRLAVAVVAIPAIVWLALLGGVPFFLFVAVAASIALDEFYRLTIRTGASPQRFTGMAFGVLIISVFVFDRMQPALVDAAAFVGFHPGLFSMHQYLLIVVLLFLVVASLVELFRSAGSPMRNITATVTGVALVPLFFGTLVGLRELFPFGFPASRYFASPIPGAAELVQIEQWGGLTVVVLLASIWVCDTAAYVAGSTVGKHKLLVRVSPNKTWEGALAGLLGGVAAFTAGAEYFLPYLSTGHAIVLGMMVGSIGQLGDLVESSFKRDAGVKDTSSFLPGHGGMYDRFDSLLFLSPVVYLYIDFVVLS